MQRRLDTVLDTMRVPSEGNPLVAVRAIDHGAPVKRIESEVLIAGGGLGGVAAALAVSRRGHSVCLLEESDWLGGQATSQGVSALDEHPYIEAFGGTRSYYHLRESIRGCAISWDLGVLAPVLGVMLQVVLWRRSCRSS